MLFKTFCWPLFLVRKHEPFLTVFFLCCVVCPFFDYFTDLFIFLLLVCLCELDELRSSSAGVNGARQRNANSTSSSSINNNIKFRSSSASSSTAHRQRTDSQRELENFGFKGVINESEDVWGAVSNLDVFFGNMYNYYHSRGLTTIVTSGLSNIITLAFTVIFSTFLFSFVKWTKLWKCRDEESCAPSAHDYVRNPFKHTTFLDVMVFIWWVGSTSHIFYQVYFFSSFFLLHV
jgi:hypothetical protein